MPIFNLSCKVTVSAYTEVEAATLEEAIAEAGSRDVAIGGLHTGNEPDEVWIIDDADGCPEDIHSA
ncbi:MAG TPA: hypothetical protein DEB56_05175 [Thiobacillus sp.]|nr:hypothetical protein [Thiobacillus sp.]